MLHKLFAVILILTSTLLLGLSLAGIGLLWMFEQTLSQTATSQAWKLDHELQLAQAPIQNARIELERTLRIIETVEISTEKLKTEFSQLATFFGEMNGTMDTHLIPGLKNVRDNLNQAKSTMQDLVVTLDQFNSLPYANFNLPGNQLLENLISDADSLDVEIQRVETLVGQASTFASDASYLVGFDFSETKTNIQGFIDVAAEYEIKLTGWRTRLAVLIQSLPGWIRAGSAGLAIFLIWFGFSQFGLIVHGLALWKAGSVRVLPGNLQAADGEM
jgi:hypothetical protein